MRCSAIGEDGEHSFAGQYETVLGVKPSELVDAFKRVIASLFSPEVMQYRQLAGLDPAHGAMAVGCLAMVDARSSGVVYTVDPAGSGRGRRSLRRPAVSAVLSSRAAARSTTSP